VNEQKDNFRGSGYVLFLPFGEGTKSDSWRPFAVLENGKTVRLHKGGANPFTNAELSPLHGAFCSFTGHLDERKGLLSLSSIEGAADPFLAGQEQAPNHGETDMR
jgi:hypothetical protein